VPDVATAVPTTANGGITDGGKVYTFRIKPGVDWNTDPARQVTAADFIREFKVFCNPAPGGFVGNLSYYSDTIVGMKKYCLAEAGFFSKAKHKITAANITRFQNTHSIAGITAVNNLTVKFTLTKPASDFLNLLALPFASARPVEYNSYLPNSLQLDQHTISDGPYQIVSYVPGKSMTFEKNPGWRQSTDSIRHQFVRQITVTIGVTNANNQVTDLRKGKFDLMLDTALPVSQLPSLRKDASFHVWVGDSLTPFLSLNMLSPRNRHAIANIHIRRALEFGINKTFVQRTLGGPDVAKVLDSVEPPGDLGFTASPYSTPGGKGSTAKCKAELARSGHGKKVTLKFAYINDIQDTMMFAAIQASLNPCGINLLGVPMPASEFFTVLQDVNEHKKPGTFDLAMVGWLPDWAGNNGRSIIDPLLRTDCSNGTLNFGCYSNHKVDKLITEAETAPSLTAAGKFWTQANKLILADAAIVPLINGQNPILSSSRVREAGLPGGVVFAPNIGGPDVTNVWLKKG
jgi:peptide/nickel transport system substrate-binding protein